MEEYLKCWQKRIANIQAGNQVKKYFRLGYQKSAPQKNTFFGDKKVGIACVFFSVNIKIEC